MFSVCSWAFTPGRGFFLILVLSGDKDNPWPRRSRRLLDRGGFADDDKDATVDHSLSPVLMLASYRTILAYSRCKSSSPKARASSLERLEIRSIVFDVVSMYSSRLSSESILVRT